MSGIGCSKNPMTYGLFWQSKRGYQLSTSVATLGQCLKYIHTHTQIHTHTHIHAHTNTHTYIYKNE